MTDSVTFTDENLERTVRRRAEYDDSNPGDLVLSIPKRTGGTIRIPLLENARSNIERDEHQENTLLRVKPLAEIANDLPVVSGHNAPVYQGKGVAVLRPGFLYVFRGNSLWRELEIDPDGLLSDVDLFSHRAHVTDADFCPYEVRAAEGEWLSDVLVPVFLQEQFVMHEVRMAYSEVQWSWSYIFRLEKDRRLLEARTTGIGHAWAAVVSEGLAFEKGFPSTAVENVAELRARDLGIELMLENPRDFVPGFKQPGGSELCTKLSRLLKRNEDITQSPEAIGDQRSHVEDSTANLERMEQDPFGYVLETVSESGPKSGSTKDDAPGLFDLSCEPGEDLLSQFRTQKGLICIAIPDPLFLLRHSLAQMHLALYYLDAVDISIQKNPMAHSAMLIRQAVYDPAPSGSPSALAQYARAIDREKLDIVLDTAEKRHAISVIERHVEQLRRLVEWHVLEPVLEDHRFSGDIAISEAYLLIADKLNVMQQIPGVLKAQGVAVEDKLLRNLKEWVLASDFLANWAPQQENDPEAGSGEMAPYAQLERLARNQSKIDEGLLNRLSLQSLTYLEKQLNEKREGDASIAKDLSNAGKVGGLISGAVGEWSSSILTVCKRLIEEGVIQQIEIQRIMQAASSNFVLTDPSLKGIEVMDRGGAVTSGSIVGVSGNGLNRGLTDFDRSEGVLTRAKDYLCADLVDDSNELMASSSPARAADAVEEAVHKVAGGTMVFFAPGDHLEARKLSLLKVDFAKRAGEVVDGPAVSSGLVVLAAFNLFIEAYSALKIYNQGNGDLWLAAGKSINALVDLTAAQMKLTVVLSEIKQVPMHQASSAYRIAVRPLFDLKSVVAIGGRLEKVGASTIVRMTGLASFIAGSISVGISFWEMRISLSNKDFDAAMGHAIAMTGGLVFLASPLMAPLLAIPGWGWAVFGMTLMVSGGLYAGAVTDDTFEQMLKRGPWGTYPDNTLKGQDDQAYYSQLLSMLSPIQVIAQRYADVEPDPALSHPDYLPEPDDYVVTVQLPLVSRLKLYRKTQVDLPEKPFTLVVQELAYMSSNTSVLAPGSMAPVSSTQLLKAAPLTKITARQSLPLQSAVRFLVKREFQDSEYRSLFYQESVTTRVRVGLQVTLDTELGPLVFPAPVHEDFEPFNVALHSVPPNKERASFDPYAQPKSPYWYFTEVTA